MPSWPSGTVTFLFTDIEGSSRLWEAHPDAMRAALARHDDLLRAAIERYDGVAFKTFGDAICAAFHTAPAALDAALAAQQALAAEAWPEPLEIRVRMALHTGTADARDNDYLGQPLNRVARLLATGHGGQVLLSTSAQELCRDGLPPLASLRSLGEHRLRDLHRAEAVYQLIHPALPEEFPRLKSLDSPELRNNLPQQLTSFIGRERELTQAVAMLREARLVTLTGAGGCGKSRLALQVAADALTDYPDGAWLVELAPLDDPDLVPHAVAQALGIEEQAEQPVEQTLIESLKSRNLLLVLDNCEHLHAASARLVSTILRGSSGVRVLATSREHLGIAGEQLFRVPSLTLPDDHLVATPESLSQFEAARLFIDRAVHHRSDFTVTNRNAPALAQLCHRLDGIPLAIELAAARIRAMSLEEINDRLDRRFRLLTGGDRSALPRQQTLRALIDWGYELISQQEKAVFARLSVFAGGWSLPEAERVAAGSGAEAETIDSGDVLGLVSNLADKSIIVAHEQDGATRYTMLETLRQYGHDRLEESGELQAVRAEHCAAYLDLAEEAAKHLAGPQQALWLARLDSEHENLRSALRYSIEAEIDPASGLRLAGALKEFWRRRGYLSEGRGWITAALSAPRAQGRTAERARALEGAGTLAVSQGDFEHARGLIREGLEISQERGDASGIASALCNLGLVAFYRGEYDEAIPLLEQSLDSFRLQGDRQGVARALANLGAIAYDQSRFDQAQALHEESLAVSREVGDLKSIAWSLSDLGHVARDRGDGVQAESLYSESLAIFEELGERNGICFGVGNLGSTAYGRGDFAAARSRYGESLAISRELGDRRGAAISLSNLANVAMDQGDLAAARAQHEESLAISRDIGDKPGIAYSLGKLGLVAFAENDYAAARSLYRQSISAALELGDQRTIAAVLESIAALDAAEGAQERAARLWGAAEALRETIGVPLPPNDRPAYERAIAEARSVLGGPLFDVTRTEGRRLSAEQAVRYALSETDASDASAAL